jgi:hypothetical protein
MADTIEWFGASGSKYTYWIYPATRTLLPCPETTFTRRWSIMFGFPSISDRETYRFAVQRTTIKLNA